MNNAKLPQTTPLKRLAWTSAFLCIACCAFIPMLVLLGVSSAVGLGIYFEFAAAGFFIASVILFIYVMFKSKRIFAKQTAPAKRQALKS